MSRAELVYLPPSLWRFRNRGYGGAGSGRPDHAAFEYDVVEALRPGLAADVGAGAGRSFFAFCEAARDHGVDGSFYAVESFEASGEGATADRDAFQNRVHEEFRGVAYLLASPEPATRRHFPDGSLGLLRIDAARAGAPLAALLDAWLPKLAPGGVLLCEGLATPSDEAEFGSRTGGGALLFRFAGNLGVFRAAGAPCPPGCALLELLEGPPESRADLVTFYEYASSHLRLAREIAEHGGGLARRKAP